MLQDKIERGIYQVGEKLPSERKLATEYDVPQSQIHRKLQDLVQEGYLQCLRGNGYFVRAGKPCGKKLHKVAFCWESKESISNNNDDFYTGLLFSFASEYSLNLNLFCVPKSSKEQNDLFMQLINDEYEGIFVFPHFITELIPAFLELKKLKIPLIFWDYSPLPAMFPAIGVDHFFSCFMAAEVLAPLKMPVTYIGFSGGEQNNLKYIGFESGCKTFGIKMEQPIMIPYKEIFSSGFNRYSLPKVLPRKLYFTSTRKLTESFIGQMFDNGFYPGKDYLLLGTDRLQFMEGSSFQLDCIMRDRSQIVRKLLLEMKHAIQKSTFFCNDYRIPMQYIQGRTLYYK